MLLHCARTDGQDRSDVFVGLAGAKPVEHVTFARGERCFDFCERLVVAGGARAKTIQMTQVRPDHLNKLAIPIAKAALAAVDYEADEDVPIDIDRHCHHVIDPDGAVVVVK